MEKYSLNTYSAMYSVCEGAFVRVFAVLNATLTPQPYTDKKKAFMWGSRLSSGLSPAHFSLWNQFAFQVDTLPGFRFSIAWFSWRDVDIPFQSRLNENVRWYSRGHIWILCAFYLRGRINRSGFPVLQSLCQARFSHGENPGGFGCLLTAMCVTHLGVFGMNKMFVFHIARWDVLLFAMDTERKNTPRHFLLSQPGVFQSGTKRR